MRNIGFASGPRQTTDSNFNYGRGQAPRSQRLHIPLFPGPEQSRPPEYVTVAGVQIRSLILDWSGTLVNDLPPVFNAVNHVLATFDRPTLTLADFRREFCLPVHKFYDSHLPGLPPAHLTEVFFERFHQLQDEIVILPQTLEFLEFCRNAGIGLFIASTVDGASYQRLAREFGIDQYMTKAYLGIVDKTVTIHQILAENQLLPYSLATHHVRGRHGT